MHVVFLEEEELEPYWAFEEDVKAAGNWVVKLVDLVAKANVGDKLFQTLSKLSQVNVVAGLYGNEPGNFGAEVAHAFFGLRQLKTFSSTGLATHDDPFSWPDNRQYSNINRLYLSQCQVGTRNLCRMLRSCNALEEVCIRWAGSERTGDDEEGHEAFEVDVDFPEIGKALAKHTETLQLLTLDALSTGTTFIRDTGGIGSLCAFTKLEMLEIDDSVLYGDILDSGWDDYLSIDQLSTALEDFFPCGLKSFCLHTGSPASWFSTHFVR